MSGAGKTSAQCGVTLPSLQADYLTARGAGGGDTPVRTGSGHKTGKRAPRGTLEHAIVEVLKRKGGLVNGEIRERLEKAGYKYSLAPLHVGKTLTRMVKAKQIRLGHSGVRMEYSLP